jgi:hypothetical protein
MRGCARTSSYFRAPPRSPHIALAVPPSMPHTQDMVSITVPVVLRDRLAALRVHPRQAYYELVEEALDVLADAKP